MLHYYRKKKRALLHSKLYYQRKTKEDLIYRLAVIIVYLSGPRIIIMFTVNYIKCIIFNRYAVYYTMCAVSFTQQFSCGWEKMVTVYNMVQICFIYLLFKNCFLCFYAQIFWNVWKSKSNTMNISQLISHLFNTKKHLIYKIICRLLFQYQFLCSVMLHVYPNLHKYGKKILNTLLKLHYVYFHGHWVHHLLGFILINIHHWP